MRLAYGQTLRPCVAGERPAASSPCDPGASAIDAMGLNLTSSILVCPPPGCLNGTSSCSGHQFSTMTNISHACNIPVSATTPVGSAAVSGTGEATADANTTLTPPLDVNPSAAAGLLLQEQEY